MNDNARGELQPPLSGESTREQTEDDGCPTCGEEIESVERRGPDSVVIQPCEHDVADTLAQNFPRARGRAMTDGGVPKTIKGARARADALLNKHDTVGEFEVSVQENPDYVNVTPPQSAGLTEKILDRLREECGLHLKSVFPVSGMQFTATFDHVGEQEAEREGVKA